MIMEWRRIAEAVKMYELLEAFCRVLTPILIAQGFVSFETINESKCDLRFLKQSKEEHIVKHRKALQNQVFHYFPAVALLLHGLDC